MRRSSWLVWLMSPPDTPRLHRRRVSTCSPSCHGLGLRPVASGGNSASSPTFWTSFDFQIQSWDSTTADSTSRACTALGARSSCRCRGLGEEPAGWVAVGRRDKPNQHQPSNCVCGQDRFHLLSLLSIDPGVIFSNNSCVNTRYKTARRPRVLSAHRRPESSTSRMNSSACETDPRFGPRPSCLAHRDPE